ADAPLQLQHPRRADLPVRLRRAPDRGGGAGAADRRGRPAAGDRARAAHRAHAARRIAAMTLPGIPALPAGLALRGVSHAFGRRTVLRDVSLSVAPGELVSLVGPSGCGKTTLLRIAAGLEELQQGQVMIDGCAVAEPGYVVPPERRGIGL